MPQPHNVETSADVHQAPPENQPVTAASWLNGGIDLAVLRCRELAGGRIRGALQGKGEADAWADTPNVELPAKLGRANVCRLLDNTAPEPGLVKNGTATLLVAMRQQGATPQTAQMKIGRAHV